MDNKKAQEILQKFSNTKRGKQLANEYFRLCLKHKKVTFTEVTKENK
tara:strand:- start:678 stop:818 length:141 start_codon:yes stop_codon:yes gene_type:complete